MSTARLISLVCIPLLFASMSFTNPDSLAVEQGKQIQLHTKALSDIKLSVDSLKKDFKNADGKPTEHHFVFFEWALVFSPFILAILVLLLTKRRLHGFNLNEALSEAEQPKILVKNGDYSAANILQLAGNPVTAPIISTVLPPTIEVTAPEIIYTKSSSRYIAFITSMLTWIIALSLSSFYIYQFLRTNTPPDLGGLSSVLLSLGIGVIPYAFNKISSATK